jgi:hypothetical protein
VLLKALRGDLAARLGVAREEVRVMQVERVTWPDGSLGCAVPGETVLPIPVEGYRVLLRFDATMFDIHAAHERLFRLCEAD